MISKRNNTYYRKTSTIIVLLFVFALLNCCVVGPEYKHPDLSSSIPANWLIVSETLNRNNQPQTDWWTHFNDDQLTSLIEQLFSSNLALKQALERVTEVNASYGIIRADKQLQLAAALDYTHIDTGDETVSIQAFPPGVTKDIFSAGLIAGWELDIWGRTTRLLEAAEQDILAQYAYYQAMMVSLSAELTQAYINIRTIEEQIRLLNKRISLETRLLHLASNRFSAGNGNKLDIVRIKQRIENSRAQLPDLKRQHQLLNNSVDTLLGKPPTYSNLPPGNLPSIPSIIGIGLPVDLITRRADIREALHLYHRSIAKIGAAAAEKYPTLSISGTFTLSSDSLDGVFDSDTLMYTLGPGLYFPILNGGRVESKVAVRTSQSEQARLALEQKLLIALAEVENGAHGTLQSFMQSKARETVVHHVQKSVQLSQNLYESGLQSHSQLLDAQIQLIKEEESLILTKQQVLSQLIYLYRSLGGGWEQKKVESPLHNTPVYHDQQPNNPQT